MITAEEPVTTEQVGGHYDELDPFYRELWGEHVHHGLWLTGRESPEDAARQLLQAVIAEAGIRPGSDICDVGCGYGASARLIAEQFGCRVTGYTVSSAQYARAIWQKPERGESRFLLKDWLEGTSPAEAFDAVIAIESTEHMSDKKSAFRRAHQALRPGGHLAVCAWIAASGPRKWESEYLLRPICREGRLAGLGTEEEYLEWIRAGGFVDPKTVDVSRQVRKTWAVCASRLARFLVRPSGWKALADRRLENRIFALTVFRMWVAFRTGALRYLLFSGRKEQGTDWVRRIGGSPASAIEASRGRRRLRREWPIRSCDTLLLRADFSGRRCRFRKRNSPASFPRS